MPSPESISSNGTPEHVGAHYWYTSSFPTAFCIRSTHESVTILLCAAQCQLFYDWSEITQYYVAVAGRKYLMPLLLSYYRGQTNIGSHRYVEHNSCKFFHNLSLALIWRHVIHWIILCPCSNYQLQVLPSGVTWSGVTPCFSWNSLQSHWQISSTIPRPQYRHQHLSQAIHRTISHLFLQRPSAHTFLSCTMMETPEPVSLPNPKTAPNRTSNLVWKAPSTHLVSQKSQYWILFCLVCAEALFPRWSPCMPFSSAWAPDEIPVSWALLLQSFSLCSWTPHCTHWKWLPTLFFHSLSSFHGSILPLKPSSNHHMAIYIFQSRTTCSIGARSPNIQPHKLIILLGIFILSHNNQPDGC